MPMNYRYFLTQFLSQLIRSFHLEMSLQIIKMLHSRPGQAVRPAEGWGYWNCLIVGHEGGRTASPANRPPLPARRCHWYLFLLEVELIAGPKWGRLHFMQLHFMMCLILQFIERIRWLTQWMFLIILENLLSSAPLALL